MDATIAIQTLSV